MPVVGPHEGLAVKLTKIFTRFFTEAGVTTTKKAVLTKTGTKCVRAVTIAKTAFINSDYNCDNKS